MTYPNPIADAIEALESTADQFRESLQDLDTVVSTLKTAFPNLFNTFQPVSVIVLYYIDLSAPQLTIITITIIIIITIITIIKRKFI